MIIYYVAIALISAATLLLELSLLRLFAVQQFYHFAFMAISLALLGAGASGSLLSVRRRPPRPGPMCLAFAVSTIGAFLVINYVPFDSFSIAWDRRQILFLALYFLAAAAPFIFAGLVVGGELIRAGREERSHSVYGANLIGSAVGSVAVLPALALFGEVGAILLAAATAGAAGLLFALRRPGRARRPGGGRLLALLSIVVILAGLVGALWRPPFLQVRLSPYKTLSVLSQALDAEHVLTRWSATARVDVVESSTIHVMPGLSLASPVGVPPQVALMLDGDNLMPITGLSPGADEAALLADHLPLGLALRLRPDARALVVEAGTGKDAFLALAGGAQNVTVVEDNALIVETVQDAYGPFTGRLFSDPRVRVVDQSGRVFVRQPGRGRFDLVVVSLNDPHRPVTSGAYTLTENYTYTVGAFHDYLDVLDKDGLLVVTRWLQWPPSESVRTFGSVAAALRATGRAPATHLLAFRTLRTMTIIAAPRPLDDAEIELARTFFRQRNYDPVYFSGIRSDELNQHSVLDEPAYHRLFTQVLNAPDETYADYRFDVRPPTDDRPFFFHYFKWRQTPEIVATLGRTWQPFGGSGYFVLVVLFILVAAASAVLILGPLLLAHRAPPSSTVSRWRLRVFVYFAGLGLAFLFVEIPLAQRFILVLDEPVVALSVVVFTVLLFSGLGSLSVRRWSLSTALGALVLVVVLYPLLMEPFASFALRLPGFLRIALSVVVIAPLGYVMGLPFAGGLRVVEMRDPQLVPWAWAINGTFSVISSVLAVMVALSWGFSAVLWLGAAAYGGALVAFGPLFSPSQPASVPETTKAPVPPGPS